MLVEEMLAGEQRSESVLVKLDRLGDRLGLSEEEKKAPVAEHASFMLRIQLNEILADGMVSDYEWEHFQQYRKNLSIPVNLGEDERLAVEVARERWRTRFGQINPVTLSSCYRLAVDERPFFQGISKWFETRSIRGEQRLKLIATGELVLTSDRILFRGDNATNKSIRWKTVHEVTELDFVRFVIQRERGKSPVIEVVENFDGHEGIATCIASRLFEESL